MSILKVTRQSLLDGSLRAWQQRHPEIWKDMPRRTEAEMAALLDEVLAQHNPKDDVWVFGYGSLIWNPAFEFVEKRPATLQGWHRRFCLEMRMGRGTPENPGLMLALDEGGACNGVAFRIVAEKVREELNVLWLREMFGGGYHARWVELEAGAEKLRAITFVINTAHPRYLNELSLEQTALMIANGCGHLGTCREYLENTVAHLEELGLSDAGLARILAALPER